MREIFVDTMGNVITYPNTSAYLGRAVTGTTLAESIEGERVLIYRLGEPVAVPVAVSTALSMVTIQL